MIEGKNQKVAVDQIEELRVVLEHQQGRHVDLAEATEIGQALIDFFELLATKNVNSEV